MNATLKIFIASAIWGGALAAMAQPANNNFANRTSILGNDATISGSLSNATSENGEPFVSGVSSGQTAWWTWTAPSNGIVTMSVNGASFAPLLVVYSGNDLATLSLVASNNYLACYSDGECGCHWRERSQITFHVAQGQAYQIAADSAIITDASLTLQSVPANDRGAVFLFWGPTFTTNILAGGAVNLQLHFIPAPKNDDFENRLALVGSRTHVAASNAGATKQLDEPEPLGNPGGSSVWYSWTAPASGRVTLSTNDIPPYLPPSSTDGSGSVITTGGTPSCGNEIDQNPPPIFYPVLAAYTGASLSSLVAANCLPMALEAYPNAVEFDAIKGESYQIAFDGNRGTTGDIRLYLALTKPASNDHFKNRIVLHGIYAAATGFNAGATHEPGEPTVDGSNGKSVWWSWTAPVNGTVSIDLSGSDYSFPIAVFTGSAVSNLNLVATHTGSILFEAERGQTYQIMVGDASGLTGAIKMKLQAPVVEAALVQTRSRGNNVALLSYAAVPGQKLLLQQSVNGTTWHDMGTAVAHQNRASFFVSPAPRANGPYYRAVVVDFVRP